MRFIYENVVWWGIVIIIRCLWVRNQWINQITQLVMSPVNHCEPGVCTAFLAYSANVGLLVKRVTNYTCVHCLCPSTKHLTLGTLIHVFSKTEYSPTHRSAIRQ